MDGTVSYRGFEGRWPAGYNFAKAVEDGRAAVRARGKRAATMPQEGPGQVEETQDADQQMPNAEDTLANPAPDNNLAPAEPIAPEGQLFHDFVNETAYTNPSLAPIAEENEPEPARQNDIDTPIEIWSDEGSQGSQNGGEAREMMIEWEENAARQLKE